MSVYDIKINLQLLPRHPAQRVVNPEHNLAQAQSTRRAERESEWASERAMSDEHQLEFDKGFTIWLARWVSPKGQADFGQLGLLLVFLVSSSRDVMQATTNL